MTAPSEASYYATPSPMTDLASCSPQMLEGLPASVDELLRVVRGCVLDAGLATSVHGTNLPPGREGETQIRSAAAMIERIAMIDPAPLAEARPPERRLLGTCRHFATLSCALLRHAGIAAR